jgi:hypothetical protein
LAIVTEDGEKTSSDEPAEATLRISKFELTRAGSGRRSPNQMRSYDWSSDPEPYVKLMPSFGPRDTDLIEPNP